MQGNISHPESNKRTPRFNIRRPRLPHYSGLHAHHTTQQKYRVGIELKAPEKPEMSTYEVRMQMCVDC